MLPAGAAELNCLLDALIRGKETELERIFVDAEARKKLVRIGDG